MTAPGPYRIEADADAVAIVDRDGRLLTHVFPEPVDLGNARLLAAAWELRQAHEFHLDGPRLLDYAAGVIERGDPANPAVAALRRRAERAREVHQKILVPYPWEKPVPENTWRVKRAPRWWRAIRRSLGL
jgi:hypothetical protein